MSINESRINSEWIQLTNTADINVMIYLPSIEQITNDANNNTVIITFGSGEKSQFKISYQQLLNIINPDKTLNE